MPFLHESKCKYTTVNQWRTERSKLNGFRPYFKYVGDGKYVGFWKDNKRDGFGAQHQTNNLIYDGQWKDDLKHGFGNIRKKLDNGRIVRMYIGYFENGKKNGMGKKFYNDGIYYGYWKNDKRHGIGIMWYNNGAVYMGCWAFGKYHGPGVLFQKNGNRYEGFFEKGLKHGEGTFYHIHTGQLQKGMWQYDICKTSMMQDEFRYSGDLPTEYPIVVNNLINPSGIVHDLFRRFMIDLKDLCDCTGLEVLPCLTLTRYANKIFREVYFPKKPKKIETRIPCSD